MSTPRSTRRPTSARIRGERWRIDWVDDVAAHMRALGSECRDRWRTRCDGACDHALRVIAVSSRLGDRHAFITLGHELHHASMPDLAEVTVRRLERDVHAVLWRMVR